MITRVAGSEPPSRRGEGMVWLLLFLALGLAARALRWSGDAPLWGDEAAVALNLLDHGYRGLATSLELGQVAPLGFLWIERSLLLALGPSERALRLLAFVAGAASLFAFWWLASIAAAATGRPLRARGAVLVPLGVFAVSYYPIRYSAELKPYALDLLAACLLQGLALRWLASARPRGTALLWALAACALLAPWLSYPSVLVGGGVVLALLGAVGRDRSRPLLAAYAGLAVALVVGFTSSYILVARAQTLAFDGSGAWLQQFWSDAFPPSRPLPFLTWLAQTHAGMMFAYPNGGPDGGSVLTLLLFLVGIAALAWPEGSRRVLGVLLAPFALAFLAACLRLYPYGGSARTSLYLAPAICLLAGGGASALLGRIPADARRGWALRGVLGTLFVLGVATMMRDVRFPQGTRDAVSEGRRIAAAVAGEAEDACVVGLNTPADLALPGQGPNGPQVSFRFYLRVAAGQRWSEASAAACRGRDRLRAVLFVERGRPGPAARFADWERQLSAAATSGAGLRAVSQRVSCTTADCRETVQLRDYLRNGTPDATR